MRPLETGFYLRGVALWSQFLIIALIYKRGVEATAGIEPAYTALQAAASPLRHVAPGDGGFLKKISDAGGERWVINRQFHGVQREITPIRL